MGEVYLAEDTNLRRKVALKILSAELTKSSDRLKRFEQEAYAASGLSHPNILVVYEIGTDGDIHFIASEFVEGETLRQRLRRKGLSVREVLDAAIQVASALAAAHKAGIIHRDIKPENIMLREDGYVKLLDFGLAKLTEQTGAEGEWEGPTVGVQTEAGTVMGTAKYMSPEQVRGRLLDPRSDIFSLGIVIYEMLTGRRPFEGQSSGDVMASILTEDFPPVAQYVPQVSAELERILSRALRKDREERYQTVQDLLIDMKTLREDLDVEARLERRRSRGDSATVSAIRSQSVPVAASGSAPAVESSATVPLPTASSAEYLVTEIRQHKRGALLVAAALILGLVGVVLILKKFLTPKPPPVSPQAMSTVRLTNTGLAQLAAVSPDGKYVAYVQGDAQQSLWLRQVSTTGNVQIIPPADAQYWGVAFSPDREFIYYVRMEKGNPQTGALYQVPVLGGGSSKLLEDVSSPFTFSPDGKRLAFMRALRGQGEMALMIANADGTGEQKLAHVRAGGFLPEHGPAWSPDGARIAFADIRTAAETTFGVLAEVAVGGGAKKDISPQKFYHPQQLAWLSDGSGLLFVGQDRATAFAPQIWRVSYPGGQARRITEQLDNYQSISLNRDSSVLAAVQWRPLSHIWVSPLDTGDSATRIPTQIGSTDGKYGLCWMPDNRIAYSSNVSGNWVILLSDLEGKNQKQLTFEITGDYDPAATPDGRYLVFASNRGGAGRRIWRSDLDGGNLKQLTQGSLDWMPNCSPDSKWVVYSGLAGGKRTIWKVGIEGGPPVQLTNKLSNQPVFSPDGKFVACLYSEEQRNSPMKIAILPSAGGSLVKLLDLPPSAETLITAVRWMPDGQGVAYVDTQGGVSNIWSRPLRAGAPRQLTRYTSDRILKFDISTDGKRIACARGSNPSDVVMISNFR